MASCFGHVLVVFVLICVTDVTGSLDSRLDLFFFQCDRYSPLVISVTVTWAESIHRVFDFCFLAYAITMSFHVVDKGFQSSLFIKPLFEVYGRVT